MDPFLSSVYRRRGMGGEDSSVHNESGTESIVLLGEYPRVEVDSSPDWIDVKEE